MSTDHIRVPLVQSGTRPELAEVEACIMAERGSVAMFAGVMYLGMVVSRLIGLALQPRT